MKRVLVVDDERIVLDSCTIVLKAEGYTIEPVSSADAALRALDASTPDLMILDVKMPGRDGISLLNEIRHKWPVLPVIVMSGYPTDETIADASRAGSTIFIAKPFTPDQLLLAVNQVLEMEVGK